LRCLMVVDSSIFHTKEVALCHPKNSGLRAIARLSNKIYRKGGEKMATVYLRDFPDYLHRNVKAVAALEGISLKALIIKALEEYLQRRERR